MPVLRLLRKPQPKTCLSRLHYLNLKLYVSPSADMFISIQNHRFGLNLSQFLRVLPKKGKLGQKDIAEKATSSYPHWNSDYS